MFLGAQEMWQLPESGDWSIYGHLNALFFTQTWNLNWSQEHSAYNKLDISNLMVAKLLRYKVFLSTSRQTLPPLLGLCFRTAEPKKICMAKGSITTKYFKIMDIKLVLKKSTDRLAKSSS
jgi:hypothetical protein